MFLSGNWTGHYVQAGVREEMHDLNLTFRGQILKGRGRDRVGSFTLSGRVLSDYRLQMLKKYDNLHHVAYLGEHDGEGTISGCWSHATDHGTFAIRPEGGFRQNSGEILDWQF